MKKNKYIKIISIILLIVSMFILFNSVYAATCGTCGGDGKMDTFGMQVNCSNCNGTGQVKSGEGTIDTDNFKPPELTEKDYGTAFEITGKIVEAITIIGATIAIVGVIILGIKYMMGSVEEKAEYKKTMIPYLVGCLFVFGISTIVSIIYDLASKL